MRGMDLEIDGHVIPLLTDADIPEKDRHHYRTAVTAETDETGGFEVRLPASEDKAIAIEVHGPAPFGNYTLVRPPGGDIPMSISSLRPVRVEGRDDPKADAVHQVRLFHAVGSVAVAGGHVEMAMKKVLVTLQDGQNYDLADVPADWRVLQAQLEKSCRRTETELADAVEALLTKVDVTRLRENRNHVIHGYWWLIPINPGDVFASRYFHPNSNQTPTNMHTTTATLQRLASSLFDFAGQLEALVTPYWPLAIVPAVGMFRSGMSPIKLHSRLDDRATKSTDLKISAPAPKPKPGQRPNRQSKRRKKR